MPKLTELTGYLAPRGFVAELKQELGSCVRQVYGDLVVAAGQRLPVAWVANIWYEPAPLSIASINDAARKLRAIQRNWVVYPFAYHRRAALIDSKLPKVSAKPLIFGRPAPTAPLGSWTLIAPNLILASPLCSSPFPNGEVRFVEDHTAPSRAYLKLWELFTLIGEHPQPIEAASISALTPVAGRGFSKDLEPASSVSISSIGSAGSLFSPV
jgi:23S rRNA (cytidine2498-2'-O)-methyltransferase